MPNSPLVSDIAAAEPAFSRGAEPTTRLVPSADGKAIPTHASRKPVSSSVSPPSLSTWVTSSSPQAAMVSPAAITYATRNRLSSCGASMVEAAIATLSGTRARARRAAA